jgi:CII-binding regulator of phage lambda lysogenization HflD
MIKAAAMNAAGWPVARDVHLAKRKKAMKNKSRCHLLSGFRSAVHYQAAEKRLKTFLLCRLPMS